jgi:plastocyanin
MTDTEPTHPTERRSRDRLWLPLLLPIGILAGMAALMIPFSRILLNTSSEAATIVALVVSVAILTVAGIAASRERIGASSLGSLLGVVAGVAMISGAIALTVAEPAEHGEEAEAKKPFVASLAAPPGASADGFAETELTVASDVPIELEFDNQEEGVPHNVQIFDSPDDASGAVLFNGETITGPATTTYAIPPLREGTYHFNCVVHPSTMTGTLTVEKDASTGGELEQVIAAQNLEFDTAVLRFQPETPSDLVFDNRDEGIQHNVSLYTDDSLGEQLFAGELITGPDEITYQIPAEPEGEYYFQCDVHPTMAGQVIVARGGGGGGGSGSGGGDAGDGGGDAGTQEEVAPAEDDAPPGEPQEQETG